MQALEKGSYLSDEKLIAMQPKVKAPGPSVNNLSVLQMPSGVSLQENSADVSGDDIFPATTPVLWKEQINDTVTALSNQFAIFKQQNT